MQGVEHKSLDYASDDRSLLFWLADSGVECVPLVLLFCWAVSRECFFQQFEIGHFVYLEHAPVGKTSRAALAPDLVGQQASLMVLYSVIVRFDDSQFSLVNKTGLVASVDRIQELVVEFREFVAHDQLWTVLRDWAEFWHLLH